MNNNFYKVLAKKKNNIINFNENSYLKYNFKKFLVLKNSRYFTVKTDLFKMLFLYPILTKHFLLSDFSFSFLINNWTSNFDLFSTTLLNIIPNSNFKLKINKTIFLSKRFFFFKENLIPWIYNNLIRFFEYTSGKKVFIQFYSSLNQDINLEFIILYKKWLPRLSSYERKLGHKFFLEEGLHIIHNSFNLHDVKLIISWVKAIIKRISFWKTRLIFRFLKYLFNNYFYFIFKNINIKGFKIKLKGKISVAGNSRKRLILYKSGKTSYSEFNLKVLHESIPISTFTGVLGLQVWIFY